MQRQNRKIPNVSLFAHFGRVPHLAVVVWSIQVMTGPGLRVRKHHRAGKGNSGLRVLRYSADEDSLVWDSHKILGAAQHVLPLSDVEVSQRSVVDALLAHFPGMYVFNVHWPDTANRGHARAAVFV